MVKADKDIGPRYGRGVNRVLRFVESLLSAPLWLAAFFTLVGALMVSTEVILRYGHLTTASFADEFSGYILVLVTFMGAAESLRTDIFPRITFVTRSFSKHGQNALVLIAYLAGLVYAGILVVEVWGLFTDSLRLGATSTSILRVPLAIPQGIMFVGLVLLSLRLVLLAANQARALRRL